MFCKKCLCTSFFEKQWFDGFDENCDIKCVLCDDNVSDYNFKRIIDYSLKMGLFVKEIHKIHFLPAEFFQNTFIKSGKIYTYHDVFKLVDQDDLFFGMDYREIVRRVDKTVEIYIRNPKNFITFALERFVFLYGDPNLKKNFKKFDKELIEYVFHPRRIKNIEDLDDM